MEWQVIVALVIGIPIIVFPVLFVWYLNLGGLRAAFKTAREKKPVRDEAREAAKN